MCIVVHFEEEADVHSCSQYFTVVCVCMRACVCVRARVYVYVCACVCVRVISFCLRAGSGTRPDLRVILMSATVDGQRFADYFGKAETPRILQRALTQHRTIRNPESNIRTESQTPNNL